MKPLDKPERRVRQRQRANGSWRIWWEPEPAVRQLGFETVELDADRLTWSQREARKLNKEVETARQNGGRVATARGRKTMDALIHEFRRSRHYTEKKHATRRGYNTNLNLIETKWGSDMVDSFTKPVCASWYDALLERHGVSYAKSIMLTMSRLFWFAERKGWRPENTNPARGLGLKSAAPRQRFATWPEFDALLAACDTLRLPQMAVAIGLACLNGARVTQVRTAELSEFETRNLTDVFGANFGSRLVWSFVRSKRGNAGIEPVHELIASRVQDLIDAAQPGQTRLLVNPGTHAPLTERQFGVLFRKVRDQAAKQQPSVKDIQFRDFRRTFGVWSRQAGTAKADIGDVLGNSAAVSPLLGETYMPETFVSAARAIDAIQKPKRR